MLNFSIIEKASAVKVGICPDGSSSCEQGYTWSTYIHAIYSFSVKFGSILVALMIIYAGYIYLTSQGDTSKISTAKDIVVGSILGYVLLVIIGAILNYIGLPQA